jgi:hypothetical protein
MSSDGTTWTDVPTNSNYSGVASPILTITDVTPANALMYEVVVTNPLTSATSGVATVSVTPIPSGLWTANFQLTNATDEYGFVGLGSYTGRGVLGSGTYWNAISDPKQAFTAGTYSNVTDYLDDGVTHSGIFVTVSGGGFTSQTAPTPSGSIATLLQQYIQEYGGPLTITGIPDGTYNLVVYSCDGDFSGGDAANLTVANAAGATLSGSDVNKQVAYFSPGDNTILFTGVEATNGTLTITFAAGSNPDNTGTVDADFNGLQLQLVGYATTVTNISLAYTATNVITTSGSVSVTNNALTLSWVEGTLQTATNVQGPWATITDPSPVTVVTTNESQYFRLKVPAP